MLYPLDTLLIHPTFGYVRYWRPAPEFAGDVHYVQPADDEDADMICVSAANLLVPTVDVG